MVSIHLISSLKSKENTLKLGQNVIFQRNVSLFDFHKMHFAMIEKNISKKREYLSRKQPSGNRATCPELGHRI